MFRATRRPAIAPTIFPNIATSPFHQEASGKAEGSAPGMQTCHEEPTDPASIGFLLGVDLKQGASEGRGPSMFVQSILQAGQSGPGDRR
jgi:hypothetical protein